MSQRYQDAIAFEEQEPGRFVGHIDASWAQGRGAYGGVVGAALVRCLERTVGDPRRVLRSLTVHYCAPVEDAPLEVTVTRERAGLRVAHLSFRAVQNERVAVIGTATVASTRPVDLCFDEARMPQVLPLSETFPMPENPLVPAFTAHLDFRWCLGGLPYSGAQTPEVGAWLSLKEAPTVDVAAAVALMDALPPAALSVSDTFRAAATTDLTIQLLRPLPHAPHADEPHLVVARSVHAADGYAEERGELWSPDGVLLGVSRQLIAILG